MESERPLTVAELAYIAGFFDGEGSLGIYKRSAPRKGKVYSSFALMVGAGQCDPRPLLFIQERFGGSISCDRSGRKSHYGKHMFYSWQTYAKRAETFLRAVQPYLIHKREQCDIALAYRDAVHARKKGNHLEADAIYKAMIVRARTATRALP